MTNRIASKAKASSRELRSAMTLAESKLWRALRNKQLGGHRFRRQHPAGPYIADFACVEARLIVEADGGQHAEAIEYDTERTAFLERNGFTVLRFWNKDVMENIESVLQQIVEALEQKSG